MRDLALLTFISLDGVMQAPSQAEEDRSGGFKHGGWAAPYWEEVMQQVGEEAMAAPYDLLLGRKTYEIFASHFSSSRHEGSEANVLNTATKYVVTQTRETLSWQNSIAVSGDISEKIAGLKAKDGPLLQVHGSWQLIQTLLANDLVDELRLWTFPVVLGSGKRLFAPDARQKSFTLLKSRTASNGANMTFYRRDG